MTEERLEQIFEETESKLGGYDNAMRGLNILSKYVSNNLLIRGAEHDIIYSIETNEAILNGLTEEDAITIATSNWSIQDGHFACFV